MQGRQLLEQEPSPYGQQLPQCADLPEVRYDEGRLTSGDHDRPIVAPHTKCLSELLVYCGV